MIPRPAVRTRSVLGWVGIAIVVLAVVFNSGYALRVTDNGARLAIPSLLASAAVALLVFKRLESSKTLDLCYLMLVVAMAFALIANPGPGALKNTIAPLGVVTLAYLVVTRVPFGQFVDAYIWVLRSLTVIALAVYVLVNIVQASLPLPVVHNFNGLPLQNGLLFFLFQYHPGVSPALGPFWEPGLFASFIAIAAVLEVSFVERPPSLGNLVIFLGGLLATHTSAGVALIAILALILVARRLRRLGPFAAVAGISLVALLVLGSGDMAHLARQSTSTEVNELVDLRSASVVPRVGSVTTNLEVYEESPVFGVGFNNLPRLYAARSGNLSQTSTSASMLAALGVLGALYTVYWVAGILNLRGVGPWERALILALFLLIVNKEPHATVVVSYCFMFYFLQIATRHRSDETPTGTVTSPEVA